MNFIETYRLYNSMRRRQDTANKLWWGNLGNIDELKENYKEISRLYDDMITKVEKMEVNGNEN